MIYRVQAKFDFSKSAEFLQKLKDGTIGNQKPDGAEIVNAMERATMDKYGYVNWTEMCFCPTPLQHERETVLDVYFKDLSTDVIHEHQHFEGRSFMQELKKFIAQD